MGKFKGRSPVACTVCHSQKLKCDGGHPCGRCVRRLRECVYPDRTGYVTIPESYVRNLERAAAAASSQASSSQTSSSQTLQPLTPSLTDGMSEGTVFSQSPSEAATIWNNKMATRAALPNDCGAERFVHDLRQIALPSGADGTYQQNGYTYAVLKSDFIEPRMFIKLPSAPLALKLLDTFEEIFCDYHWFLRRDFRDRVKLLFVDPEGQTKDRSWLSRASLVFALATTFIYETQSSWSGSSVESADTPSPPGSDMFEQAVLLLNMASEEPTTEDIEALNLMAFYCYSLNRRRMAYKYATQGLAVSKLLCLDKSPPPSMPGGEVLQEHRKRLWWTSFCMERMTVAELGLSPAHAKGKHDIGLPSLQNIPETETDQFFDPSILSKQTEICEVKCLISEAVSRLRRVSDMETMLFELWPCLDSLRSWRESVPSYILFDFKDGVPAEMSSRACARGIASLYLRYHQCFTVLLRPFFSKELSLRLQGVEPNHLETKLSTAMRQRIEILRKEGIQAARNNCKILIDLFSRGKHAKFGYWDSVHAFSSLSIIIIARAVAPELYGNSQYDDDEYLYTQCRLMLRSMAEVGNPAAKDHSALLVDAENIVKNLTGDSDLSGVLENSAERVALSVDFCENLWSDVEQISFLDGRSQWPL